MIKHNLVTSLSVAILGLAISCAVATSAIAQKPGKADTVDYRHQEITLSDGTIIDFGIGAFGHIHNKQGKPDAFIPMTSTQVDGSFLRTVAFPLKSQHDSIRYVRSVFFPHPARKHYEISDSAGAKEKIGTLMTMMFEELGRPTNIPLNSAFDGSSDLRYILELRDASTNRVLSRLDTVRVFKNSKGELRWRHYKQGGSGAYSAIGRYYPAEVYLNVTRINNLPASVSLEHEFFMMDNQSSGDWIFKKDVWMGPMVSYKNAPASAVTTESPRSKAAIRLFPNPANEQVQLSLDAASDDAARIALINTVGQVEYSEPLKLTSGGNTHSLLLSGIPAGSYTLMITSEAGVPLCEPAQLSVVR